MRKSIFFWLLMAASFFAHSQKNTLYEVNFVTPKAGMKSTFETNWKLHLAKFHKNTDKRMVYEVLSGPRAGSYHIVEGPIAYADMDTETPNAKEHALDLEKTFQPYIKEGSMHGIFRWDDTASYNRTVTAEKFLVTVTHVKFGQMPGTLRESKRNSLIQAKLPYPSKVSVNTYFQMMSGSDPVMVTVRGLKDGFRELETDYFGPNQNPPNAFKDAYIKDYGQEAWDARSKLLDENANVASREMYMMKLRKDLSSN